MKEKATKPKKRKSEINGNASPLKKKKESEEYTDLMTLQSANLGESALFDEVTE
jgi:hypothetical protein